MSSRHAITSGHVDLSVIVVNYNTRELLRECLSSIARETKEITHEVVVVDNGSTDGSPEMLAKDFPSVRTIFNSGNKGFSAANNQGFAVARGEYLLMLNSDTIVKGGALQRTLTFVRSHPGVDIVGCKLLNPDGTHQPSVRSFPDFWNVLFEATFLYRLFPRSKLFGRYYMSYFGYDKVQEVDWLSGAFLLFDGRVYKAIGGLDERFFMYSEEVDFCRRARDAGFHAWFFPEAEVIHVWAGSASDTGRRIRVMHNSQVLYLRKHFRGVRLVTVLSAKILGVVLRVPVYLLGGIVRGKKDLITMSYQYLLALFSLFRTGRQSLPLVATVWSILFHTGMD